MKLVHLTLIGVGGTGSLMLTHLVRLHFALQGLGAAGLHVECYDPDTVSPTNVLRQQFSPHDIGKFKAVVLTERCNLYGGLSWRAHPRTLQLKDLSRQAPHVIITCVDSGRARREIGALLERHQTETYWLDCGNAAHSGQVVLGHTGGALPSILMVDPNAMRGKDDTAPSCSAKAALKRQALMINPLVALQAAALLSDLLLYGAVESAELYVRLSGVIRTTAKTVPEGNQRQFTAALQKRRTAAKRAPEVTA